MSSGITTLLDAPYFTGRTVSAGNLVPYKYPIALNGRVYLLDTESNEFRHTTIPLLRQQSDQSRSPSEASLNPEDLWRRAVDTWHLGAGQTYLDRDDETTFKRFRTSKGVDPWTRYQISLLPDTDQKKSSANTNLALCVAGGYLYLIDGTSIQYTQSITPDTPTWADITGEPATAASSICSNGYTIWTTHGADGVFSTTRGAASTAVYATGTASLCRYVKARLMVAGGASIYNVTTGGGALPTALFTHNNTDFAWVDFCEARQAIIAAGYSGDKSLLYRIAVKADGTALDAPVLCGELPDGEIVRCLGGYLGFVVIGSDKGWRFAAVDTDGDLQIGPLVTTANAVRCFEGQERFVWYGLTNYDTVSTGLGRFDLTSLTVSGAPAYASDLMATAQGNVLSIVTFQNLRVFTVSGSGVWAEWTNKVASGTISSGWFNYGLPDTKLLMSVDVRTLPLAGSYAIGAAADGSATYDSLATVSTANSTGTLAPARETDGEQLEILLTLNRDATTTTTGPTILRWTARSLITATSGAGRTIFVPLLLHEYEQVGEERIPRSPILERQAIAELRQSHLPVLYQEGGTSYSVSIEDYEWRPHHLTLDGSDWNGTLIVKMKEL